MGEEAKQERNREAEREDAQIDPEKPEEKTENKVGPPHSEINKRSGETAGKRRKDLIIYRGEEEQQDQGRRRKERAGRRPWDPGVGSQVRTEVRMFDGNLGAGTGEAVE